MKKLGVIVPYRNRLKHLEVFKDSITNYLNEKNIPHEIIIINQDDAKLFNRGALLNIGYLYARQMDCDYVVFHDVDMLPVNVDYSYSHVPLHLANDITKETFDTYFGGVTMFPIDTFEEINGYSNKYWGWGYEDDDLLVRCKKFNVPLDEIKTKNIKGSGSIVKFNGVDAYVKGKNTFKFNKNFTLFISFYPEKLTCDTGKDVDEFSVFSVPGYDFSISYTSFSRYNFCTFDEEKNALYINSKIKTNYKTNIALTINYRSREMIVYQDGEEIGVIRDFPKLFSYTDEKFFYIGAGNPKRFGNEKYFKGYFDSILIYSKALYPEEVLELSQNYSLGGIPSSKYVKLHYNAKVTHNYKLIDLSGGGNHGEIFNCELKKEAIKADVITPVPFRRESEFKLLPHEENGFLGNKWKDNATRWNQLRFYNEVLRNRRLIGREGLKTLKFVEHGRTTVDNITHINIGI